MRSSSRFLLLRGPQRSACTFKGVKRCVPSRELLRVKLCDDALSHSSDGFSGFFNGRCCRGHFENVRFRCKNFAEVFEVFLVTPFAVNLAGQFWIARCEFGISLHSLDLRNFNSPSVLCQSRVMFFSTSMLFLYPLLHFGGDCFLI